MEFAMLPLEQILKTKFEKAIFGGYDTAQVDSFVETVISEYNKLKDENEELKDKLQVVLDKVVEYQKDEEALHSALLTAQKAAAGIVNEAKGKASAIIGEAEKKRDDVVEAAKRITEVKRQEYIRDLASDIAKLDNCRKATEDFVKKTVRSYQIQIERLQTITGIELDKVALYKTEAGEETDIVGEYLRESAVFDAEDAPEIPEPAEEKLPELKEEDLFEEISGTGVEASVAAFAAVPSEPAFEEEDDPLEPDDEMAETIELTFLKAEQESKADAEPIEDRRDIDPRPYERRLNIRRESETIENGMHTRIVEVTLSPTPEEKEAAKKKGFRFGHEEPEEDTVPNRPTFNFEGLQFGDNYDPKK
jgi:cell division initiation protein